MLTEDSQSALRARVWVAGRVQGVAYRAFAWETATRMGLKGGVRNLDDGRVLVEVEGERQAVESFLELLRAGPPAARVDDVRVEWASPNGQWADFQVWY